MSNVKTRKPAAFLICFLLLASFFTFVKFESVPLKVYGAGLGVTAQTSTASTNTTLTGADCRYQLNWTPGINALSMFALNNNDSGAFQNTSWTSFSGQSWSNYTQTLTVAAGNVISWGYYTSDSAGNHVWSGYFNFTVSRFPSINDFYINSTFISLTNFGNFSTASGWSSPANAYDGNIYTCAYFIRTYSFDWTDYLVLNLSSSSYGADIEYYAGQDSYQLYSNLTVDIANQTGSWTNVYAGTPTFNGWTDVHFSLSNYTAVRYSFYGFGEVMVYETYTANCVPTLFSFNCTDNVALSKGIFQVNATNVSVNSTVSLSGTQAWANYTVLCTPFNCQLAFDFWVNNTLGNWATLGARTVNLYSINNTGTVSYFNSLGNAIAAVEAANNWSQVDPYDAYVLSNNQSSVQSMIDSYANEQDWTDVLKWSAICNKIWGAVVPADVVTDLNYALGNFTMLSGTNLPQTYTNNGAPCLLVYDRWSMYGYYFANQDWALAYDPRITSKWNITAAYNQFDAFVNYSINRSPSGLPLYIYATGGQTYTNRYYDEDAETISFYILFGELMNVSDAINKAVYWWSYLVNVHWNGSYFGYTNKSTYECEASFFLKVISQLKYYYLNLQNWSDVLIDIQNRFLASEWNSPQWSHYVVVHASTNAQTRLENTLGAWQVMLGVYSHLNTAPQADMIDMLCGNQNNQPAWALLLNPGATLYDSAANMFQMQSNSAPNDPTATAEGETLLFLLGIVPGNTTVALPLEELRYEYTQDIDPQMFQFDAAARTITVPVNDAGSMSFQYGTSPVTAIFDQGGIWQVTFSNSWNMITNMTYLSALPTACPYFSQLYPPPYNVTIKAYCAAENEDVNVNLTMDGSSTGYMTPQTITSLNGTHTFTVPENDSSGDSFKVWSTNQTSTTITVSSTGTCTAYYGPSQVHDVRITDIELSKTIVGQGYDLNANITAVNLGDYPETFNITLCANTTEIENIAVTNLPNASSTLLTLTWNTTGYPYGNYSITAYPLPIHSETDFPNNTMVSNSICITIPGDLNGDFHVNLTDLVILARAYGTQVTRDPTGTGYHQYNPNADIGNDGAVNLFDLVTLSTHWTTLSVNAKRALVTETG